MKQNVIVVYRFPDRCIKLQILLTTPLNGIIISIQKEYVL
jgi:hypothetical protein